MRGAFYVSDFSLDTKCWEATGTVLLFAALLSPTPFMKTRGEFPIKSKARSPGIIVETGLFYKGSPGP